MVSDTHINSNFSVYTSNGLVSPFVAVSPELHRITKSCRFIKESETYSFQLIRIRAEKYLNVL